MAMKLINDWVGPDGLISTVLVYCALSGLGLPTKLLAASTYARARAQPIATEEMYKHFAKRQMSSALATRNGPDTSDIKNAPINSLVLVY